MPPGSGKRKRPDRQYSQEDAGRPSPHRPEHLGMANHGSAGSPRGSYGGRGRGGSRRGSAYGGHAPNGPSNNSQPRVEPSEQSQVVRPSQTATPIPPVPIYQPPQLFEDAADDPLAPYDYEHLTDEVIASWKESGRQILMEGLAQLDTISVSIAVQELIRAGLDKRISAAEAGETIKDLIAGASEDIDVEAIFVDSISLLSEKDYKRRSLAVIAASTGIDPEVLRHELDVALLQSLQLVRPTFDRMRTRKTTNVLYRQANFNLLREESEGYAKLMTDFYNASSDFGPGTNNNLAKEAFNRITALVGAFDLDVGRVLDLTMDISAAGLVKYWRFFTQFYRCSSWWPENIVIDNIKWVQHGPPNCPDWALPNSNKSKYSEADLEHNQQLKLERDHIFWDAVRSKGISAFSEIGARHIIDYESVLPLLEQEVLAEEDSKGRDIVADQRKRTNENRKYMRTTKTLPPQGSPDAAQLLGFKLRYYAEPHENDSLPENLVYFAALLIKIGFISLRDLYPHLYPADEAMEQVKEKMEAEKQERDRRNRPGGGENALTAAVLSDDTKPEDKSRPLTLGKAGTEVKNEEVKPIELANQKIILLKALLAIGAIPEAMFMLGKFPWLLDLEPALPSYMHRLVRQMLSQLSKEHEPLAGRVGLQDTMTQVYDTAANTDGTIRSRPRQPIRLRYVLGLERGEQGDGCAEQHYYTDWDENVPICRTTDDFWALSNTLLNFIGIKIGQDAKIITTIIRIAQNDLKRDSSDDNKTRWLDYTRRTLLPASTLTEQNPAVAQELFALLSIFNTTTRYRLYEEWYFGKTSRLPDVKAAFDKNRAEVKDVLRRVTNESGKRMARALAKVSFSSPGIAIMAFTHQLENYSNMISGLVDCIRYFSPLAYDILSWTFLRSLSGEGRDRVQGDGMLTSNWLRALSRFMAVLFTRFPHVDMVPPLKYVASEFRRGDVTNLELIDQVVTEMAGIRADLSFGEEQLFAWCDGGKLFQIMISQKLGNFENQRQASAKRLVKGLAKMGIMVQMLLAIAQESQMFSHRETSKAMPLKVLSSNLDKVQQVLLQYLEMVQTLTTPAEFDAAVPDVVELIDCFGLSPTLAFAISRHSIDQRRSTHDSDVKSGEQANGDAELKDAAAPWHPVLDAIATRLPAVTGDLHERVNMQFYVTFWTMTPQDLKTSLASYDAEVKKVDDQRKAILNDNSDRSGSAIRERLKKESALEAQSKQLTEERKERFQRTTAIKTWLNTQKTHWFAPLQDEEAKVKRHLDLLQDCFLPRALFSPADAMFAYRMLALLHSNNTPGFSLLTFLEQLIRKQTLLGIIFTCTNGQAASFGRFLHEILKLLQGWHAKKVTFEKEALGPSKDHTGFATEFDDEGKPTAFVDFEEFRRMLFFWHNTIKDTFKACLECGEYMHIYNGITVLRSLLPIFPALKFHGKAMQDVVKSISANDPRGDIKMMALSLQAPLNKQEKSWVIPQDFKMSNALDAPNGSVNGDVEMHEDAESKLNAAAPDFTPAEVILKTEDGEIEDEPVAEDDGNVQMKDSISSEVVAAKLQSSKPTPAKDETKAAKPAEPKRLASDATLPAKPPASQVNGRPSNRNGDRASRNERPVDSQGRARSRSPTNRNRERDTRRDERPVARSRDSTSFRDDNSGRSPRPAQSTAQPDRAQVRSEVPTLMSSVVSQVSVNPARAALINGDNDRRTRPQHDGSAPETRGDAAPTGPRGARPSGDRDLFNGYDSRGAPSEPTRGRGRGTSALQGESNYGRLNGGTDTPERMPPPNGPARAPRAPRDTPALHSRASDTNLRAQDQPPRRPPPERSFEQPRSAPATPAAESGPAIHPSRLANVVPPIETNGNSQPPSGPRAQTRRPPATPTGPSPASAAHSGPGSSDRPRRGERPRTETPNGLANTSQGTQFRGAARQFQEIREQDTQPRSIASPMEAPAPRIDPGRQELIQRNNRGYEERPERPSRNSSRERYADDGRGYREEPPRDRRPRDDDVPPRRPLPPQSMPSGPGGFNNGSDYNARGSQRGYQDRPQGPPRGPDEFRSSRGPAEGNDGPRGDRKRRHEDGQGANDGAKRRRSGQ